MIRLSASVSFFLTLLCAAAFPYGFQYGRDNPEIPLKWKAEKIRVAVSESFASIEGEKGRNEVLAVLQNAAKQWHLAGAPEVEFYLSDVDSVSPAGRSGDGISVITIEATADNVLLFSAQNASRPATTRIFYNRKGMITEADIVLNPYFPHSTSGLPGSFDLETTIVHELGHLLGLGHSGLPGASMYELNARNGLYGMPFSMLRTLSSDDVAGIRALYGSKDGPGICCAEFSTTISISDDVQGGWLLWAEDRSTGSVVASVTPFPDGTVRLGGVPEKEMRLFARFEGSAGTTVVDLGNFDPNSELPSLAEKGRADGRFAGWIEGVGINGELAGLAVPLNPGNTYRLYAAVKGWGKGSRIKFSSEAFQVVEGSYETSDYGDGLTVVSFLVVVDEEIPEGLYSLRLEGEQGISDALPGAVSVGPESNPWVFHPAVNSEGSGAENK